MEFENLRIKSIDAFLEYTPRSLRWTAENRCNHIVGIQLSGSAMHDFGYQKFNLSENCVFFFNQAEDYSVEVAQKGVAYSVHFTTYEPIATKSFCRKIDNETEVVKLLKQIERQKISDFEGNSLTLSYLYKLCHLLEKIRCRKYIQTDKRIMAAKELIDAHFKEKDCLQNAAALYGVSRRRFNDIFKSHFNITPNRYLIFCKISLAKALFKAGYLSVSEISELSGFSDVYYFSKVFKAETGFTPSQFSNLLKDGQKSLPEIF
ncbi:MAG: helix-turn-helix transcriptional regulator [Clostridia bacterium]|nr:helix-turn-helix transcriptional regulator [Clostridia bacterium]